MCRPECQKFLETKSLLSAENCYWKSVRAAIGTNGLQLGIVPVVRNVKCTEVRRDAKIPQKTGISPNCCYALPFYVLGQSIYKRFFAVSKFVKKTSK